MNTLFPERYPLEPEPIRLDSSNIPYDDNHKKYWEVLPDILIENFKQKLADKLPNVPHITLFAIAPQPLLILLGTLIGDLYKVEILQRHRDSWSWKWQKEGEKNGFIFQAPANKEGEPVLIFAISGSDIVERVKMQLGEAYSYWIVSCENPNRDMMKTKRQLIDFEALMRTVINDISANAVGKNLKVFPAMPLSCAIAFGHIRLPKADMPWELYDLPQGSSEYVKTITI